MPRKSININNSKNKKLLGSYKKRVSGISNRGYPTQPVANTENIKVQRLAEKMLKSGALEPTEQVSPQSLSLKIFTAAGCSFEVSPEINNDSYTLISDQLDTETVDNPNKIDTEQFKKIKKLKITVNDIFKNETDSIFTLDESIPKNYDQVFQKNDKLKVNSVIKIASLLYDINFNVIENQVLRSLK